MAAMPLRSQQRKFIVTFAYIFLAYVVYVTLFNKWLGSHTEVSHDSYRRQDGSMQGFSKQDPLMGHRQDDSIQRFSMDPHVDHSSIPKGLIEDKIYWREYAVQKVPKGICCHFFVSGNDSFVHCL